jgi:hypothetical protein
MTMTLTPEDITLIQQIARKAAREVLAEKPIKRSENYTQVPEIRNFIIDNFEALLEEFGSDQSFDIAVLRHWLAKQMQLKPNDMQILADGYPRFFSQISNALNGAGWPNEEAPIQPTSRRSHWVLRTPEQSSLDIF